MKKIILEFKEKCKDKKNPMGMILLLCFFFSSLFSLISDTAFYRLISESVVSNRNCTWASLSMIDIWFQFKKLRGPISMGTSSCCAESAVNHILLSWCLTVLWPHLLVYLLVRDSCYTYRSHPQEWGKVKWQREQMSCLFRSVPRYYNIISVYSLSLQITWACLRDDMFVLSLHMCT